MFILFDPSTLLTISTVGSAVASAAGSVVGGLTARENARAAQKAAEIEAQRDIRTAKEQFSADAGRIRAILSTAGASDTELQTMLAANARAAASARTRILQDTAVRVSAAQAERAGAPIQLGLDLVGGGLALAGGLGKARLLTGGK